MQSGELYAFFRKTLRLKRRKRTFACFVICCFLTVFYAVFVKTETMVRNYHYRIAQSRKLLKPTLQPLGMKPVDPPWSIEHHEPGCILNLAPWSNSGYAPRTVGRHDRHKMLHLFSTLDRMLRTHNIRYFVPGGALYGSYFMHDLLPWDDDADIYVHIRDRAKMEAALLTLAPEFQLTNLTDQMSMKLHYNYNKPERRGWNYNWVWPFADIFFVDENRTHIYQYPLGYGVLFEYPKEIILPLHLRPCANFWIPAPRDTLKFLSRYRKKFTCGQFGWSHQKEYYLKKQLVNCSLLDDTYAFVHRSATPGGVLERLIFNGSIVHSCLVKEPEYAITKPHSFDLQN